MKNISHLAKYTELILHLVFWLILVGFLFTSFWSDRVLEMPYHMDPSDMEELILVENHSRQMELWNSLFLIVFKAAFFYVNVYLIFPRYKNAANKWKYLLPLGMSFGWCFMAEVLLYTLSENNFMFSDYDEYNWSLDYNVLTDGILAFLGVLVASFAYWATKEWLQHKEGLQKLDVTTAELALLKNQVNPHFLFNTLNNLFSMAIEKNADELAQSIAQLTQLMRYSIYESHVPYIELYREVEYIENYIKLQRLRFSGDENITIQFDVEGDTQQVRISPMLLINFVENAFKHGVSLKQESYILINLRTTENELYFSVENTIYRQNKTASVAHAGFGQEHVKKLLQLQYPNRHTLTVTEEGNVYKSVLRLELQKTQVAITALQ
ncbi:sensor histidine kinase [Pontibacter rugosus]|uniref:Sensor histidine kinase n=1 Tax=Pontibacter rugosus TaxID=1745966 RepID=A0ABW3SL51_9BACT